MPESVKTDRHAMAELQHFTEVQVSGTRSWSRAMKHGHVIAMHAMYALLARDIADLAELSLRCHQTIIAKNG